MMVKLVQKNVELGLGIDNGIVAVVNLGDKVCKRYNCKFDGHTHYYWN